MKQTKLNIISALLFVAAMAIETSAWAQTFTIDATYYSSTNKTMFTITRSGSSLPQQTIKYRTVNLSAYAGVHYTAVSNTYTFPENITSVHVEVSEYSTSSNAFQFQNGTTRSYRFEVLDVNGFQLAYKDRSMTTGTSVPSSGAYNVKDVTIYSDEYWADDRGYDNNGFKSVLSSHYFNNAAPKEYFQLVGAELRMTLTMQAKEEDDAYQYLQILFNDTVNCDNRNKCDNGNPGNQVRSIYMAGFEIKSGVTYSTYNSYTFPVISAGNNEGASNPWGYGSDFPLDLQKFNTQTVINFRADDGRLILPLANFNKLVLRLNASGSSGSDKWWAKNVVAHIQAVEANKPTLINGTDGITVSAGPYVKGNTFYISVPFSEIVHVSGGSKQLNTSWGNVTYVSGDYTNVITFEGTINTTAGTTLAITGINNCMFNDLAGNYDNFSTSSFNKTFNGVTCTESYTLAATNTSFEGLNGDYVVSDGTVLPQPNPTVYFYKGKKENANKVQLTENTNYTLSWTNNNAAGNGRVTATGTGIYTGSASTTFPIRWSTYTVSFHENGSTAIPATGTMSDQAFQYGVAQNLTANAFSREGFTFAGWNTQPDGSGASYSDGEAVTGLTSEDGAVIDLYAQWMVPVLVPEVTVSNSDQTVCLGDSIEDMIITATNGTITSVTGLPAGLTWSGTMISGIPEASGTATVTVTSNQTPNCGTATATVTITVNPLPEVTVTNNVQTICMDNQIQEMKIIYSNGTIESVTGLPENVNWSDTPSGATIFGAPAEYGTFNATVTVTSDQGCGTATADVTITVNPNPGSEVANNYQKVCVGEEITPMVITAIDGTLADNVNNLPTGLNWSRDPSNTIGTISGAPEVSGTFGGTGISVDVISPYGCSESHAYIILTVNPLPEVTVTNSSQTVCLGNSIETMEITATNGTIANVEGLPAGVTWSGTMISGTPTESGTFNVTVMVDSYYGCGIGMAELTIIVNPLPETYTLDITGYGDSDGGWNLIASPLAESIAATEVGNLVAETALDFDLYRFNQAANMEWENWKQEESEHYHFNLESGQGYLYASKEDVTLTFLGTPNSDDAVNVSLSYTEGKPLAGYNLVGNPFAENATLNKSYYSMNAAGTGLVATAADGSTPIAPCTGVIVQATEANQSVTFTKVTRGETSTGNGSLNIALGQAQGTMIDNAIVSFDEGSQLNKFYFGEQNANIYILQDGKEYAIVSAEAQGEVPVNFKAKKNGEYTLTVSPTFHSPLSTLHLIDNLTGADIDLLQTPSYTFSARNDDYASRFKLVFNANEDDSENEDFAFISDGEIIVNGEGTLQVIDVLGRVIVSRDAAHHVSTAEMVPGVYVLQLINGENVKTQKIVIR